jgi:hypothetical protein
MCLYEHLNKEISIMQKEKVFRPVGKKPIAKPRRGRPKLTEAEKAADPTRTIKAEIKG